MMDSREVGLWLEECLQAASSAPHSRSPLVSTEETTAIYCSYRESLCVELLSLLQEAEQMSWPFVPEKWQYKQPVSTADKSNLADLISQHLPPLLALLKASILAQEAPCALAVIFLVDRFLYWTDESSRLLRITQCLHRRHPDAPVAPQLVIRQARVYLNSGKLQKAEYILSRLISNSGATGCWVYHSPSDRALVQAVSIQVRGLILQKLGLWLEAAGLIWASLVGYYALPQPDKKGIGTSLGVLANILVSMNDEDFRAFKTNPDIDLSLLGDQDHRLLSAAEAAKMAVVYSQYASLYVLTNVAAQGTCLLSYSFSMECPVSERRSFLLRAREAFEIGLLTKAESEPVTSQQELHTFIKAAYSLTVTDRWLGAAAPDVLALATLACQKALACFYDYCRADNQERDGLCAEIMRLVSQVKHLLRVEPFPNSDKGSFIPDSYRNIQERPVDFTLEGFSRVMARVQKHHASLCEPGHSSSQSDGHSDCITAMGTTVGTLSAECTTESHRAARDSLEGEPQPAPSRDSLEGEPQPAPSRDSLEGEPQPAPSRDSLEGEPQPAPSRDSLEGEPQPAPSTRSTGLTNGTSDFRAVPLQDDVGTTLGSTEELSSSWQRLSLSSSGSPRPSSSGYTGSCVFAGESKANVSDQSCPTTEVSEDGSGGMEDSISENGKRAKVGSKAAVRFEPGPASPVQHATSTSSPGSDSDRFELLQAAIETAVETDESWIADVAAGSGHSGSTWPITQRNVRTGSSLSDSLSSRSSWDKLSLNTNSPTSGILHPTGWSSKPGTGHCSNPTQRSGGLPPGQPEPDANKGPQRSPRPSVGISQCAPTETWSENSFEMLEASEMGIKPSSAEVSEMGIKPSSVEMHNDPPHGKNPWCYSCVQQCFVGSVDPERQYALTEQDRRALLAGVCHVCLLKRLQSEKTQFKLNAYRTAYSALHLKFSRATGLWAARETCAYIGELMGMEGKQRTTLWVQFLHQEERLSSYVGKDYLRPRGIQFHLHDVERQMTAQYYVTEFNKSLYDKEVTAHIFFIPSEVLLVLDGEEIVGCITVEPYMLGDFVKLTNNTWKKEERFQATEYGIAFGHFTYQFSNCQEVVVDLQGWVTANGKGLTYLTDPQIHSSRTPRGPANFADRGLRYFLEEQHGPECNRICQLLKLPPMSTP